MDKLLEFGRKAMFYVRVLSGYEERRIRSYRIQLQQRLQKAQEKKAALKNVPEQIILSEVRRMVEDMQSMNKKLEDTQAAIEEYFKPIDKEAEIIMKTQLEGEEKSMREMMMAMQRQALLEKAEAERIANSQNAKTDQQHVEDPTRPDKKAETA
ncbi:hypothetical protein PHJA_002791600 [Phtheirospermum japonicum]|uniref:Uncharacterized protein n=1 Tax=Phtheirospermum japonicum TaxID=374723 RepID=A0A830DID5_9LAMI|nr:hypothetical protein PHJA_002791600 [Phtheirospermum japonicum]